jgi:hypothetical protein
MAKLINSKPAERENNLKALTANGAKSLQSGVVIPEGTHSFTVAEKKAFGFLEVHSQTSGDWVLPIVAGTMKCANGETIEFVLSEEAGAKTLVIPDAQYLAMELNKTYAITVEKRKGQSRVTQVEPADALKAAGIEDDDE